MVIFDNPATVPAPAGRLSPLWSTVSLMPAGVALATAGMAAVPARDAASTSHCRRRYSPHHGSLRL
jgi:hypothetical protein